MMMTKKQLKANRRRKSFERKRNIRINNLKANPAAYVGRSHSYRLYEV